MKLAKSHKIILMITAFALSVICAFCALSLITSKAAEPISSPSASNYFSGAKTAEFTAEGAKLTFDAEKNASVKNELSIDNMKIELGTATNISSLKLVLTYDSFYVNGNENTSGGFDKEIKNTFDISSTGSFTINVENNVVKVNGTAKAEDYYKIRKVDKAIAKIEFEATITNADSPASIVIKSIDQDTTNGEGKYKQTLVLADDKLTPALPVVALDADLFVREANGKYSMVAYAGQGYNLSYDVYSVIDNVSSADLNPSLPAGANIKLAENDKKETQDYIHFKTTANATETFNVSGKDGVVASYAVKVVKAEDGNNTAPEYNFDASALKSFKAELESQYKKDGKVVPLGTEIEIPSMEDIIVDDRTPYEQLTKKMYFASREESNSTSLEITLNNVGDYYFYVLFTDSEDEGMDKDDFVKIEDNGDVVYGKYGSSKDQVVANANNQKAIFYFNIAEDTEIAIEAPTQGKGYKGSRYTASKFDITSSNCDITYTLEYATSEEAGDWKEIKKFSGLDEDYEDENYDYEELQEINYNGEYTFTPNKVGVYKITVNVVSKMSFMSNSASTVIKVEEEAKVITPSAFSWVEDNVLTVVLLGVIVVCLTTVVVLLFVKPKDKQDDED